MNQPYETTYSGARPDLDAVFVNSFMRRVYNWMAAGLGISAFVAWFVSTNMTALGLFFDLQTGQPTMIFWGSIIGELVLVVALSAAIKRIQVSTAIAMFVAYAALNGATLAMILLAYTGASVGKAFVITAGTFVAMSIYGATTKRNLTGMGSFLMMGLIGIIIAMVVNMFLASPMVDWIVSIVGVGIFVGLTAYDTQKLRGMVMEAANDVTISKMVILGALTLYLDFLNLFLMLLRLFGDRR